MPQLYWNPLSINYLIEFIMTSLVVVYFAHRVAVSLRSGKGLRTASLILGSFGFALMIMIAQFLAGALHPDQVNIVLPWASPAAALSMMSFVLFAYYFRRPANSGVWFGRFLILIFGSVVLLEVFIAFERHLMLQDGFVEYRAAWVDIPVTTGTICAFLFFFGHMASSLAARRDTSWFDGAGLAFFALIWPPYRLERNEATVRAFFYVSLMPMGLGLTMVARSYGLLGWAAAEMLACWFFLMTVASFTLVYLNYVPGQSSFRVKLVGITLMAVLFILCGISWLIGAVYLDSYQSDHFPKDQTAIRFEPKQDGGYIARRTRYYFHPDLGERVLDTNMPIRLPAKFPFYEQQYEQIFVRHAGFTGFNHPPLWRNIQHRFGPQPGIFLLATDLQEMHPDDPRLMDGGPPSGLFVERKPGETIITWSRLESAYRSEDVYSFQLRLYATGAIEIAYADLPEKIRHEIFAANLAPLMMGIVPEFKNRILKTVRYASELPVSGGRHEALVENFRVDFLAYFNRIYEPIAVFILIASLAILIIFPYFFQINLDRPLKQLLFGVREIMAGKLATSISVLHRDEIGYLAQSFNDMAKAQNELVQTLEDKVSQRTAEATEYAAQNARLEERNYISRELHDAVSQTLFSANLIVETLPDLIEDDPGSAKKALGDVHRLNKDALSEMRHLLLTLRQEKMTASPFGELLRRIISEVERNFSIPISCEVESDTALPAEIQLAFYRIAQECLNNAAKYSGAPELTVYFHGLQDQALLSVKDDGCGFDVHDIPPGHLGVQIMKERMQEIGGTLHIDSQVGQGTEVTAIWFDEANE